MQEINKKTYLYNHTSEETAYIVEDYPWGFRLRTTIRYWIESKEGAKGGQRFVSQTIDPRTGRWCKPKKSTYKSLCVMFLDENEHVRYEALSYNDYQEWIDKFKTRHSEHLNEFQQSKLCEIEAYTEVMKHVKFKVVRSSVGPVSLFSKDPADVEKRRLMIEEQEERKKVQKANDERIAHAMNIKYNKLMGEAQDERNNTHD